MFAAIALTLGLAQAAPLLRVDRPIKDSYIVQLKDSFRSADVEFHIKSMASALGEELFNTSTIVPYLFLAEHGFPAYSAKLSISALAYILAQEDVALVEEDMVVETLQASGLCQSAPGGNSQTGATWGIARTTNCKGKAGCSTSTVCTTGNCPYYYSPGKLDGTGVSVYVIDTGVYCSNDDFTKKTVGSCTCGFNAYGNCNSNDNDANGHGTHCASTVGGQTYGVAKGANIISVKVLSDQGSGTNTDVINGVNFAASDGKNKPSIASMSLGGGASTALDNAVNACTNAGTLVVVAAGNDNLNACNYSPARATGALTVGATANTDARSSFSNFGNCLQIFAPGSSITAAWITSKTSTNTISGTSMACPHVAGIAAKVLSVNSKLSPTELRTNILDAGTANTITNPGTNSPNLMAYAVCV